MVVMMMVTVMMIVLPVVMVRNLRSRHSYSFISDVFCKYCSLSQAIIVKAETC